jgi:hypothetical protein
MAIPHRNLLCHNGVGEIRTLGTVARSAVFKTAAFDHSATTPGARKLGFHNSLHKQTYAGPLPAEIVFRFT